MRDFQILEGDCFEKAKDLKSNSIDLIYLDPPFYTQKEQKLSPAQKEELNKKIKEAIEKTNYN